MPTISTAARNAACNGIVDLIDAGTLSPEGSILIETSGGITDLVTLPMSNPAFGDAAIGVATANAITPSAAVAAGTAAQASIRNRDGVDVISGLTVGTTGADINFANVNFQVNDLIGISSLTATMPAS